MAFPAAKSAEKTSKSLIDLSFTDLTKIEKPHVCKRRRSISESAYHRDPELDLICSDFNEPFSSSSTCSQQSGLLSTTLTNSNGYSIDCSDLNLSTQQRDLLQAGQDEQTFNDAICTREDTKDKGCSNKPPDLDSLSECAETIDEMVSDLIGHLHESTTNVEHQTWRVSQFGIDDSNSTRNPSATPVSDSIYVDDETTQSGECLVVPGISENVRSNRPSTPYYADVAERCENVTFGGKSLRRYDSIAIGFGIFERDVELSDTTADDISISDGTNGDDERGFSSSEDGTRRLEDTETPDGSRFPPGFPKEVIAALGNDGDAIMQAAMQWRRLEGFIPLEFSSSSESTGSICRICHGGDSQECLMHPCRCDGSVRWTHQTCLIKWLAECGVMSCELCGAKYRIRRVGSRNCLQWKPIELDVNDRLHLILFLFASAFLLITFSFVVWFSLSHHDKAVFERRNTQSQVPIIFPIYSCLDAVALAIICFESKHTILRLFRRWRAKNMGIIVLNRKDSSGDKSIETATPASDAREQGSVINLEDIELQTPV